MSNDDRHINFKLMRNRILAQVDPGNDDTANVDTGTAGVPPARSGEQSLGKNYWRSLEEFIDAPEFREFVEREYPQHAEEWNDPVERRTFLKLMGASLALAGLSGCVYRSE